MASTRTPLPNRWQIAEAMYMGADSAIMSSSGPCILRIERTESGYYVTAMDDSRIRKTLNIYKLLEKINANEIEYDWISSSVFVSDWDIEQKNDIAKFIIDSGLPKKLEVGQVASVTNGSLMTRGTDNDEAK